MTHPPDPARGEQADDPPTAPSEPNTRPLQSCARCLAPASGYFREFVSFPTLSNWRGGARQRRRGCGPSRPPDAKSGIRDVPA